VYEVKDPRGGRLACKVVTKSSLKTKKAKTKVSFRCTHPLTTLYNLYHSYTQKLRSTVFLNIRTSCGSRNVLKTTRMYT
jgi:hypothetical protein